MVDLKGHSRGRYWLVKADARQATLRSLTKTAGSDAGAGPPIPTKHNDSGSSVPLQKLPQPMRSLLRRSAQILVF
jgi:hypothetical protein